MDQWVEPPWITTSGAMTRKEDFVLPSRSYMAEGVRGGLWPDRLPPSTASKHISFFPFISYYITCCCCFFFFLFFSLRGVVIIRRFSQATICEPAEGPGQFPEHAAMTDALCAGTQRTREYLWNFFAAAYAAEFHVNTRRCRAGDYCPLGYMLFRLWLKWCADL